MEVELGLMPSGNRVKFFFLMRGFYSSCLGFDCTWPDGCLIARYSLSPRIPAAILRSRRGWTCSSAKMVAVLCPKTGAIVLVVLLLCTLGQSASNGGSESPHIFVVILARNQEHTLRNFLGYFEGLDYPKHRMSVW